MTSIDMIETRRDWTDRLCRPVRVTAENYGDDSGVFDSLEQAEVVIHGCGYLPEDGLQEDEYEFVTFLMNPATGSVAPLVEWEADFRSMSEEEWGGDTFESAGLVEVQPNGQGGWQEV